MLQQVGLMTVAHCGDVAALDLLPAAGVSCFEAKGLWRKIGSHGQAEVPLTMKKELETNIFHSYYEYGI